MVKALFSAGFLAAILAAACGSSSAQTSFSANLAGANEVPATTSSGTGTATFTLNGTTVSYTITYTGLSGAPSASHIHVGATTVSGPVVVAFSGLPTTAAGTFSGSFTQADIKAQTNPVINTLDDLLAQMRSGNIYANIHSQANPGGEIRGQLH